MAFLPTHPPFFIIGCGRSGTTLFRMIMDHHPDVAIPLESLFIVDYLRANEDIPVAALKRMLLNDHEFLQWKMPLSLSDLDGVETAKDLIDRIHKLYLIQTGKRRYGQKTPRFIRYGHLLKTHYPDAKFIHIIRDPRAVTSSLIRSNLHRSNAYYAAKRWRMDVEAGLELHAAYPGDVLEIRYENFVENPENILKEVCTFLDMAFDSAMLIYHESGLAGYHKIFNQAHNNIQKGIRTDRIYAWRDHLSPQEVNLVDFICADTMQRLGYYKLESDAKPPAKEYIWRLTIHRYGNLGVMIAHRLLQRLPPLYSFVWRKIRLGLFFQDLAHVNF